MDKKENKTAPERWRPWLVNILLLFGASSVVAAAFLVGAALGFLVLGAAAIVFALLIHLSGGDGTC